MVNHRGTTWNKWDLHVHTPMSIEQEYGGNTEEAWEKFFVELEALDQNIRVIGISDYWFLDGYKKVIEAHNNGRFSNIAKIFPVVEARIDRFGTATKNGLSRVNVHFILNPEADVDRLYADLCGILECEYGLSDGGQFKSVIRPGALEQLGNQLLEQSKRSGETLSDSALRLGFANFQAHFTKLRDGLQNNRYLKANTLVVMGRREWEDIKWGGSATAEKHSLMSFSDLVFTASPTREDLLRCVQKFVDSGVNSKVFHCSDAHEWPTADSAPRTLGHCFTWINADMTFAGLKHALAEYKSRIAFEPVPQALVRESKQPGTIISNVRISSEGAATPLFDTDIPLNSGFVTIIGNKGQGKSALVDSIAHGADSGRQQSYSFLNKDRFLGDPEAKHYKVELLWGDRSVATRQLNDMTMQRREPLAEYLPQQLVERICSADPTTISGAHLETEIERVIFQHIPSDIKGKAGNFSELQNSRLSEIKTHASAARGRLKTAIDRLVKNVSERDALQAQGLPALLTVTEERIKTLEAELEKRLANLDDDVSDVSALVSRREKFERLEVLANGRLERAERALEDAEKQAETAAEKIQRVRHGVALVNDVSKEVLDAFGGGGRLAAASIDEGVASLIIEDSQSKVDASKRWADAWRKFATGVASKMAVVQSEIDMNSADAERREAEGLRSQVIELRKGDGTTSPSVASINRQIARLGALTDAVENDWKTIQGHFEELHKCVVREVESKSELYSHASERLVALTADSDLSIDFNVDLFIDKFSDSWVDMVNKQKLGSLEDLSSDRFDSNLFADVDLLDASELWDCTRLLCDRLSRERASSDAAYRGLSSVMRSGHHEADLMERFFGLDWMVSRYRISADGRDLNQLSPGQRGLILLLFYLLLDKQTKPLLLDQPEENLDNESIRRILIPAIMVARANRQIIAVTHNANLAVVGDADQVVLARREQRGNFSYEAGSLADFNLGKPIVDILEGSQDAFDNRGLKYQGMSMSSQRS